MDIQMPGMDGYETTRMIRSLPMDLAQRMPIVALTADISEKTTADIAAAGMNTYLIKPVDTQNLYSILKKYYSCAVTSQVLHEMAGILPEYADEVSIPSVSFGLFDQLFSKTPGEYVNFLQTYVDEIDACQVDFDRAVVENNYAFFRKTRHKINAAIHHLKADELKTALLKMEDHLKGTAPTSSSNTFITDLQTEFNKIKEAILEKMKSLK